MASFAAIIDTNEGGREKDFSSFVQLVAGYKSLESPSDYISGRNFVAAKLDYQASLHKGITVDKETGSCLIAAGTLVYTQDVDAKGNLCGLLADYLSQGTSVFELCSGMFALVVYNGLTQSISVVSDPFGYFSVFYGDRNGRMFVSTSALAVAEAIRSEPSEMGVNCFLQTGKVFGNMTLWRDVKRMRAATVLEFTHETVHESTYWMPTVDEAVTKLSLSDSIDLSMEVLQRVLKRNLEREGKIWTDLTGGYDTRFLTMLLERVAIPFKANSVGAPQHPDVRIARTIASKTGWDYQSFELPRTWPQECPHYLKDALGMGDAHLNVLFLARPLWANRQRSAQHTVLLSGLGGEMWRGPSWWPEKARLGESTGVRYDRQLWSLIHPIPDSIFVSDPLDQVKDEIIRQFSSVGERYSDFPNAVKLDCVWTYRETAHVGAWGSFLSSTLRSMSPLFSKDIVNHVISLNYLWKKKNQLVRHMFVRYRPLLANIPVEGRGPAVPKRITNFYKFIPARLAFYGKAANKLSEITLGRSLLSTRHYTSYSQVAWRRELLKWTQAEALFDPLEMRSISLYHFDQLQSLLSQAHADRFQYDEFLGRIITVEMALRAVDVAID